MSKKYQYKPSWICKTGSKYKLLTEEYQDIFKEYILKKDKNEKLFFGIKEISTYIANSFFYIIEENYDQKTNQEKVISAIYFKMSKIYGSSNNFKEEIKNRVEDLAELAVLYSLGMERSTRDFMWNPLGRIAKEKKSDIKNVIQKDLSEVVFFTNFIRHCLDIVFKSLIYDLMKEYSEMVNMSFSMKDMFIEEEIKSASELIELSNISWSIPVEIKEKIRIYLDEGEKKHLKEIQPYLELIYSEFKRR